MALSLRQLNRSTLARQLLLGRERLSVPEAVRAVVAVQAQEPASPYVALWNRVEGFDADDLDRAYRGGDVVKASLMRITLHTVHAGDYTTFHEAVLSTLRASRLNDRRFKESELATGVADALLEPLLEFTSVPRTRQEIESMFAESLGEEAHARLWWALRTFAPIVHAPVDVPWAFGRPQSFLAAPASPQRPGGPESIKRLIERYLLGFGPATRQDFARFALLPQSKIRPVLDDMDHLVQLEGPDGAELLDMPGIEMPDEDTPAPPRLMAMWDSVLLAHADRTRIMSEDHRKLVIRNNGDVLPTLLVDGRVAGVWRHVDGTIEATAFGPLGDEEWEALSGEAANLLRLLSGRDDSVYKRYHRWWDKLPNGETRSLPG